MLCRAFSKVTVGEGNHGTNEIHLVLVERRGFGRQGSPASHPHAIQCGVLGQTPDKRAHVLRAEGLGVQVGAAKGIFVEPVLEGGGRIGDAGILEQRVKVQKVGLIVQHIKS